jgi:predicted molibdopterin-dependent oxidoreductase YjgC
MFRKLPDPQEKAVTVFIDGAAAAAAEGETVAAVLLRQAEPWARATPISGAHRAPYCMMGVCFDCLAVVDGIASVQTCLTPVRDGMRIERQIAGPVASMVVPA